MIINNYMDKEYNIKIKNKNIDIFDYDEIVDLVQEVIKRILKKGLIEGLLKIDIYVNYNYGIIMDIKRLEDRKNIDIRIEFHIDSIILSKTDYFYLKDIGVTDKDIYYDKGNFFILYDNDIGDDSEIIYGERANEIVDKGIRLRI